MTAPNKNHQEILQKIIGNHGADVNSEYLEINIKTALAAMQILQNEIDVLKAENERLKSNSRQQRGFNRLDEIEGKDF